jgi:hypothetical protein
MDKTRKITSSCFIIQKNICIQNKERILKAAREEQQTTYKGKPIKITQDFSTETLKGRKEWNYIH